MHCRIFSSVSGLCTPDTRSTAPHSSSYNNKKCPPALPDVLCGQIPWRGEACPTVTFANPHSGSQGLRIIPNKKALPENSALKTKSNISKKKGGEWETEKMKAIEGAEETFKLHYY